MAAGLDNTVDLTIVVPCLNAERTLEVQLEALAAQQWSRPWELIIADNGSSDQSIAVAGSYADRFQAFRIIDASQYKTSFFARNAGVTAARSNRIAFCDADDEVAPGWVAAIGDALDYHDVVYGLFRFDKFNAPDQAERANEAWKDGLYHGRFLPGGGTGNLGIRRWVHEALDGFDQCLPRFGDADFYWRLQLEGFDLQHVPEAVVQVRIGRVKPGLRYLYWRGKTASAANYWLYQRYRSMGMLPPKSLKQSLRFWLRSLRGAGSAGWRDANRRRFWLEELFTRSGDVVGQIQARLVNPCKPFRPSLDKTHRRRFDRMPGGSGKPGLNA